MATERTAFLTIENLTAGEAIAQHTVVYLKSDGKVYNVDSAAIPPTGTAREAAAAAGDRIDVALHAASRKVKAGGTCTIGSLLEVTTGGLAIDVTTDNNNWVLGMCLETVATGQFTSYIPIMTADTDDVSAVDAD